METEEHSTVQQQRQFMAEAEADGLDFIGPCPAHLGEAWIDIPLPNNQTNRTKVVWPKSSGDSPRQCPLVIYFHGGGFSVGSPDQVLAPARGFASLLSCVVACPSLNQLPEWPFPEPMRMAWEACAWLSDAGNLNNGVLKDSGASVDPGRGFVVGGNSSGGAAAAIIGSSTGAARAGVEAFVGVTPLQHPITGIFSGVPFLVSEAMLPAQYRDTLKSRELAAEANPESVARLRELEGMLDVHSPWFSPINLDLTDPKTAQGHPPRVFAYAGQYDQFRDDVVIYEKWLSQLEDVEVKASVLDGEDHNAWVSPPWPTSHSHRIKEVTLDGMAWLLNVEWDRKQVDHLI